MADGDNGAFDAGEYWRKRVISGSDLGIVGHRSMGQVYNGHIYERRLEVLNDMLERHTSKPVKDLRVLDIGCGSGFYTGYWAARGVRDYLGVDISSATIEHLSAAYPDYEFLQADITQSGIPALDRLATFDVVTVFDVFYHIVDDERFSNAVRHIGRLTAPGSRVLVMDQLFPGGYQLSKHVVYRDRDAYLATFNRNTLELADAELLFHYLVPPLSGNRLVDYVAASVFKLVGVVVRLSDRLAHRLAMALRRHDRRLRSRERRVANSEMLVFQRTGA